MHLQLLLVQDVFTRFKFINQKNVPFFLLFRFSEVESFEESFFLQLLFFCVRHAHNALEGWWKTLSGHTCDHLEELELKDFDADGLEDTVRMFQAKKFPKLKRLLFVTIAYTARNCEERLRAELPSTCDLVVKKSETQI